MDEKQQTIDSIAQGAEFAYVVVKQKDGRFAISHIQNETVERQPSLDDIYASLSVIQKDMQSQQTAIATMQILQQANQAAGKASGLVVPSEKKFVKRS